MLVLVRHARTAWNVAGRLNSTVDLGLDEEGSRQALALGQALGRLGPVPIVRSPARRARETARPVEAAVGQVATVDERLAEVDLGRFEGHTMTELADDEDFARWRRGGAPVGAAAEALPAAARRAATSLSELVAQHTGRGLAVVIGHGVLLRAVLCTEVLGLEATAYRRLRLDNTHAAVVAPASDGAADRLVACNVPPRAVMDLL